MHRPVLAVSLVVAAAVLGWASPARADDWLPHPADATWTYSWTDSVYNTVPTKEKVTVEEQKGDSFGLAWTTDGQDNPAEAPTSVGLVTFVDTSAGLVNTNWTSNAPPDSFPILCAKASSCRNSLASAYYNVIWGSRTLLLASPLVAGSEWQATGGVDDDVTSTSSYVGVEKVSVPAFQGPVLAAKVRTDITQAGALGDPYGSGVRTTWWVYGVGPVKVVFQHSGGSDAPVTTALLESTSLTPKAPPVDANYFPMTKGLSGTYRWTNARHLKKPVVEKYTIDAVLNGSARFSVSSVSGPIKVAGSYVFTARSDGVTNISGATKAALLATLPPLGPKALPKAKRRHFLTPFDLMTFGFNPVIPAYPQAGMSWSGKTSSRDFAVYGVTGTTKVLGVRRVKVPAGRFSALAVQTRLRQAGFPFGSGTRTSWFAPGRGLVKLVFRHGDGSVSRVDLLR